MTLDGVCNHSAGIAEEGLHQHETLEQKLSNNVLKIETKTGS